MRSRVLVVDDDADIREALRGLFSVDDHDCEVAPDAATALAIVDRQTFDIVISDIRMEGMSGLELLGVVRKSHPALPVILITGLGGIPQAVEAVKRGAFEYLTKPIDVDKLRRVVASALDDRRHPGEDARLSRPAVPVGTSELIGTGAAMRTLQSTIDFVAKSSAPVLIQGETGVGKELVARAIHERSARSHQPFVAVNTSAIPHDLLEGELFGHVRGGFTGAVNTRKGLLTEADGGTLFLDEIGDMPLALQAKLLRVLQFGDVRPVGSDRSHHVDVRVLAATHRDLAVLVKEARFREDLFYRLNVLQVFVPPLRDRREDIPALAAHFLAEACRRAPLSPVRSIGVDSLRALTEASWPGNVRELASSIERAVVFGVDEMIDVNRLSLIARDPWVGGRVTAPTDGAQTHAWPFPSDSPWSLRRLSLAYVEWAVSKTAGDKKRAAEMLGIDVSTLYRWQRARD
jgi:two-component system response regulator HydG